MKVSVKDLAVTMNLGTTGIQLDVYDNQDKYLGDLRIGKAKIEWCKGKPQTGNGHKVSGQELITWFESQPK